MKNKKAGTICFEIDEHPRPLTTMEILQKLPTIFKKNGLVTAGSASVRFFRNLHMNKNNCLF